LLEHVHPVAIDLFKAEGFDVETYPTALTKAELCQKIKTLILKSGVACQSLRWFQGTTRDRALTAV
jgi:hypothetical protein